MRSSSAFALVGFLLVATAAAQPGDTVVKVPVTPTPAPGTNRPGDGQAPIAADAVGSGPVNAAATQALLRDVASSYGQMEANIEVQFAKLKKQAKDDIDALQDKIKEIDRHVAALKEQAKKIEQVAEKMAQINAQIDSMNKQRGVLRGQIAALERQLAKLEADRQKAIADLKKQKEKAIADVQKAQDARLNRVTTPTPTPKRP